MKTRGLLLDVANQVGGASPNTTTLKDFSRFGNDGTLTGVAWTQLPSGLWVMDMTDADDRSEHGTPISLMNITDERSFEAWVKLPNTGATQTIWHNGGSSNPAIGVWLLCFTDGKVRMYNADGVNRPWTEHNTTIDDDTWHHVIGTFSINTGGKGYIYIDGVANTGDDFSGANPGTSVTTATIGEYSSGDMSGYCAMFRIYNYHLTPAQVRARYKATRWLFTV